MKTHLMKQFCGAEAEKHPTIYSVLRIRDGNNVFAFCVSQTFKSALSAVRKNDAVRREIFTDKLGRDIEQWISTG
jgi:hypothetical protein